jgi:hypothetical protein
VLKSVMFDFLTLEVSISIPFSKLKLSAAAGILALSSATQALTISAFDGSNLNNLVSAIGVSGVRLCQGLFLTRVALALP